MDRLYDIVTARKIPLGEWARGVEAWVTTDLAEPFEVFSQGVSALIETLLWVLQVPHPLVVVLALAALVYALRRSVVAAVLAAAGFLLIINQGYWEETAETLALIMTATLVCMGIGVPLGILAARRDWVYQALRPVLDLMQTVPAFVYLIPAILLFGVGTVPGLVATVIFVLPAPIRLTRLGIASTPKGLEEAARAFGATSWQRLVKVELPHARPQILAGLTQTIMLSLSMVVIAALVGAEGLGVPTLRALNRVDSGMGFEVGISIVVLAIVLDRMFKSEPAR